MPKTSRLSQSYVTVSLNKAICGDGLELFDKGLRTQTRKPPSQPCHSCSSDWLILTDRPEMQPAATENARHSRMNMFRKQFGLHVVRVL